MPDEARRPCALILASPFRLGREPSLAPIVAADILARRERWRGTSVRVALAINHGGLWALSRLKDGDNLRERLERLREEGERTLACAAESLALSFELDVRFSLDRCFREASTQAFFRLYEGGYLSRRRAVLPWCGSCLTVLDPDRARRGRTSIVPAREILVALKGSEKRIPVLFTAPELLGAAVGLAISPDDSTLAPLIGRLARLPLYGREVRFVGSAHRTAAGQVRPLTPAYDQKDFETAQASQLAVIDVLDAAGSLSAAAGRYAGLARADGRRAILADLAEAQALGEERQVSEATGECEICGSRLGARLSDAWFVDLAALREKFPIERVIDRVAPSAFRRRVAAEAKRASWCISRRSSWGLPLPVWFCASCDEFMLAPSSPPRCGRCGNEEFRPSVEKLSAGFVAALWPVVAAGGCGEDEDEDAASVDTLLVAPEESELAYLTLQVSGFLNASALPRSVACLAGEAAPSRKPGASLDAARLRLLEGRGSTRFDEEAERLFAGLREFVAGVAGRHGAAPEIDGRELPLLERWLLGSMRHGIALIEQNLACRRLARLGSVLDRSILSPVVDVYAPRAKDRPPELVAFMTYELCMHALPWVAVAAPRVAEEIWLAVFNRPLTLASFPPATAQPDPAGARLARQVHHVLRLVQILEGELHAASAGIVRGTRSATAFAREVAAEFGFPELALALDRPQGGEVPYRGRLFGDLVLLTPVESPDEGNLADVIAHVRRHGDVAKRRRAARHGGGEFAELVGELRRFVSGGRPVSGPREP